MLLDLRGFLSNLSWGNCGASLKYNSQEGISLSIMNLSTTLRRVVSLTSGTLYPNSKRPRYISSLYAFVDYFRRRRIQVCTVSESMVNDERMQKFWTETVGFNRGTIPKIIWRIWAKHDKPHSGCLMTLQSFETGASVFECIGYTPTKRENGRNGRCHITPC